MNLIHKEIARKPGEISRTPGQRIRNLREERGLRPVDVQRISEKIKVRKNCADFFVSHATLNDIENIHSVPSVRRMFSLAACFRVPLEEILSLYGVAPAEVAAHYEELSSRETPAVEIADPSFFLPFDIAFDPRYTAPLVFDPLDASTLPEPLRTRFDPIKSSYAWVGTQDASMEELIPAGSLLEVDRSQTSIGNASWSSMRERPIYFCWTKDGYRCAWCEQNMDELMILPHPASHVPVRYYRTPREANVIGRVASAWVRFRLPEISKPANITSSRSESL